MKFNNKTFFKKVISALCVCTILFTACDKDDDKDTILPELQNSGMENNTMNVEIGKDIVITPKIDGTDLTYEWKINGKLESKEAVLKYTPKEKGVYKIHFTVSNEAGKKECDYVVNVTDVFPKITATGDLTFEKKKGEMIEIAPSFNADNVECEWKIGDRVISTDLKLKYSIIENSDFKIQLIVKNSAGTASCQYSVKLIIPIRKVTDKSSAYLTNLLEYKPAPGQFINEGFGLVKDAKAILGKPNTGLVSLGGFGGYISVAFDHTITNKKGKDFIVYGNAFKGSSEAGIVMVSFDYNGNGKADDGWFELAGSEYNAKKTIHNYEITYTNPKKKDTDVAWKDNQGNSGFVKANSFHTDHNYYPEFIDEQDQVTFTGTLLPNNKGTNDMGWIVYNEFKFGYADNFSSEYSQSKGNEFEIDWAVDKNGKKVTLPGVDFIKVYTGVNIDGGILGEASTEIMGAADLSLLK